jgi:peptidoglycan/xylan/chitin deacetylase (PgdA/CDA1 family)
MESARPGVDLSPMSAADQLLSEFWWPTAHAGDALGDSPGGSRVPVRHQSTSWVPLHLSFVEAMRPPWLEEDNALVMMPLADCKDLLGEPLVVGKGSGRQIPLVVHGRHGIAFAFDLGATLEQMLFARAFTERRPLISYLPFHYHRIPPRVRASLGKMLRGTLYSGKRRSAYPQWPIEPSVEVLRWLWYQTRKLEGHREPPVPFWPEGRRYAVVLTHDVDTAQGQENIRRLADLEEAHGLRSCWYVTGRHYVLDYDLLQALLRTGHEIGLHGDTHDSTLAFGSAETIRKRLEACREPVSRLAMKGFRSPYFFRTRTLLREVEQQFMYDSSIPDTGSFLGAGTGCGSVFPLAVGGLQVIPTTVPPDGALLADSWTPEEIIELWLRKIRWIKAVGGVAVVLTHPEPEMSARRDMVDAYGAFLQRLKADQDAWFALPREVARHWRLRGRETSWHATSMS